MTEEKMMTDRYAALFDDQLQRFIQEWKTFLRFPTISAESAHNEDCEKCAAWLREHIEQMGLRASVLPTGRKPVVFAERAGEPGRPTVLFYGHYDVQPVDPLAAWQSPPFEPVLRDGRMFARGAEDNKGQLFAGLKAIESLLQQNELRCSIKVLLEGEEESGSAGLERMAEEWRERLQANILLVCDTGSIDEFTPAITMGLRGTVALTVRLEGSLTDLHSGMHGGVAVNPAAAMARLISSLHDEMGAIAVEGYYEGLEPVAPEDRALAMAVPFDAARYTAETGAEPVGGERGLSVVERRGFRPTIEINGLHSGYAGEGSKTIIPQGAMAKISSRLVAGQDPQRCLDLIIRHLERHAPAGLRMKIDEARVGGPALRVAAASPVVKEAAEVLNTLGTRPMVYIWEGASIPVVSLLSKVAGAEPLLVGFGLERDNIHAPNESFGIEQFKKDFLFVARYLRQL